MNSSELILQLGAEVSFAVLSMTLYGLAVLWAATERSHWVLRWAPIMLLLAALAPIGAYELVVQYGTQATVILGTVFSGRLLRASWQARAVRAGKLPLESLSKMPGVQLQFQLSDAFKAFALLAAILAIVRYAAPSTATATGGRLDIWPFVVTGIGLGAVTLAAAQTVFGNWRWHFRIIALLFATVVAGASNGLFQFIYVLIPSSLYWQPRFWCFIVAGFNSLLTVVLLSYMREVGWNFWPRESGSIEDSAPFSLAPSRSRSVWRWLARASFGGFLVIATWLLGSAYLALLPLVAPQLDPLPNPNGYDELAKVRATLNWSAIPSQDVETASAQTCQAFVQANAVPLANVRQAIVKPSRVPVIFAGPSIAAFDTFRCLLRALAVEAKAAANMGKTDQAIQSYLDTIRMAQTVSRGGVVVDEIVANSIEGFGLFGLQDKIGDLDAASLAVLCKDLGKLADGREPLDTVIERDRICNNLAYGWVGRLMEWVTMQNSKFARQVLPGIRASREARFQLLLAEAAIRRYVLQEGSPPESLASLVPEYLSSVPRDPFGDGPLVYRRTSDGYLLYSVGGNRTDDGGQRVSFTEATTQQIGDLFFDAPAETAKDDP